MDLTHRFSVPATRDEAWTAFANLEQLAPCFPGATITSTEGGEYAGTVKVKLGPIALVYTGTVTYLEQDRDRSRMVIEARGRDKRGNGTATATVAVTLVGKGEHTDVEVQTDLSITGKPAQFGRGVISDVSDKLLDQFANCLSDRFADGLGTAQSVAEPERSAELGEDLGDIEDVGPTLTHTDAENAEAAAAAAASAPDAGAQAGAKPEDRTDAAPPPAGAQPAAARSAAPRPTTPRPPATYTPPNNTATPDFDVLATVLPVLPVLLKRYWPVLGGAAVALFVVSKITKRARR